MFEITDIQELLPHRYPFLLIDRIIDFEPNVKIVGLKNVTINEPFFEGHFPGNPIMPGVLIIEAIAQAGGILAFKSGVSGKILYFMSIEKAKFRKPVVPGDQLRFEVKVLKRRNNVWRFAGEAFVGDKVVSEVEYTAMLTGEES
jgi:3-hydroxyacyl-[acyl-carrier-protein] dehydratase